MTNKATAKIFIFLIIVMGTFSSSASLRITFSNAQSSMIGAPTALINEVNFTRIQSHVRYFSSLSTRMTGYPGGRQAMEHIVEEFNDIGLKVDLIPYRIVVPLNKGAWIYGEATGINITAYPLWPNDISVSQANYVTGKLRYVGNGSKEMLNGIEVKDSVLLMDFNSQDNWVYFANLRAKAVIFVEPSESTKYEALTKAVAVPVSFPRLYVNAAAGMALKTIEGSVVTINSKISWQEVTAYNVMGILEGEQKDDVLVLSSHYDSWSVVPDMCPAAEDSIGVSVLLELARYFNVHKPLKTIWFVAYSGHWEGLTGPVEWVDSVLLNTTKRVWLQIGLDYSSESSGVDILYGGPTTVYVPNQHMEPSSAQLVGIVGSEFPFLNDQFLKRFDYLQQYINSYITQREDIIQKLIDSSTVKPKRVVNYGFTPNTWWGTQPEFYMLDTEPVIKTNAHAVTILTQYARRIGWFTPLNNYEIINWKNIMAQTAIALAITTGFANQEPWPASWDSVKPVNYQTITYSVMGSISLKGKTVEFNYTEGWYTPIDSALVRMYILTPRCPFYWPFTSRFTMSDVNGSFIFHGLAATLFATWSTDAWKFDADGNIVYALDMGFYGTAQGISGGLKNYAYVTSSDLNVVIPMFKCTSVAIFDLYDTGKMRRLANYDLRNPYPHAYYHISVVGNALNVWDMITKSQMVYYQTFETWSGIGVVFVKPDSRISITYSTLGLGYPSIMLINSTDQNPEGSGFFIRGTTAIYNTAYQAAKDMFYMTKERYLRVSQFNVKSSSAVNMLQRAEEALSKAELSFERKDYTKAYAESLQALSLDREAYQLIVMPLYDESSRSVIFFTFLILPFAILFERLIFIKARGSSRVISLAILLIIFFSIFSIVHPAFSIMSNSGMAILGVGIFLLTLFIIGIFLREAGDIMEEIALGKLGRHVYKGESTSVALHTLNMSVENMRRHSFITTIMFITVILYTAAQTSLTSTTYAYIVSTVPNNVTPPYDGIVVKTYYGFPPDAQWGGVQDVPLLEYLRGIAGEKFTISPRIWLYPIYTFLDYVHVQLSYQLQNGTATVILNPSAFLGMSSKEAEILLGSTLKGSGIGLDEGLAGLVSTAILPQKLAEQLNVTVGDRFRVNGLGIELVVAGTYDPEALQLNDFDGYPMIPATPDMATELGLVPPRFQKVSPTRYSANRVIILPWKVALQLGGFINSVALIPKDAVTEENLRDLASSISYNTDLSTIVGYKETSYGLSKVFRFQLFGWEIIFVPLAIACASMANFMFHNIMLRKKEIFTYSSLGLSPTGAFVIFFTEALTYALGGAVIGYLLGWGMNSLFISFGILPQSFSFNFVSSFVMISLGFLMLSILLASLYPVRLAAGAVTPSLERKWKLTTKPRGDNWEIPLPLRIERDEARGILTYLQEYFQGYGSERPSYKITNYYGLDTENLSLKMEVLLLPGESGVVQNVAIMAAKTEEKYGFFIVAELRSGDRALWTKRSYFFVDDIRKQLLLWRSIPPEQKKKYIV